MDPSLFKTLCKMREALRHLKENPGSAVLIDGCDVADLGLTMTVPGYETLELCPDGTNVDVTAENLEAYVEGVTSYVIGPGVSMQLNSFREGFDEVFVFVCVLHS